MTANIWAIMDDKGILYQSNEEGIRTLWKNKDKIYAENKVTGDLKLIEIHEVSN